MPSSERPRTRPLTTRELAAARAAETRATLTRIDTGEPPKLLDALAGPCAPLRGGREPRWMPIQPGMLKAVHVRSGLSFEREFHGQLLVLDKNAAWVSAAASVSVAHGQLVHTAGVEYAGRPGYYRIQCHPWHERDMPHPLGELPTGDVWVPEPTVALLAWLVEQGRWPDITILDSYTADRVRLTDWTDHVKACRKHAIETYGGASEEYAAVKQSFGQAMSLVVGTVSDDGRRRTWKTKVHRPDWRHTIEAHTVVTMWRKFDSFRRILPPDLAPIAIRNVDELLIPDDALEILLTGHDGRQPPLRVETRGITLGTWKVKGAELWE